MGYELQYTSQVEFDGTPYDCLAYGEVFGSCKPLNYVLDQLFTGVCTLLNFSLGDLDNVGTGVEWYVDGSDNPYEIRSFITQPGLKLTDLGDELSLGHNFISSNNSITFANVGSALDIRSSGGMNFVNIGTGTGEVYDMFQAGFFQMRRLYGLDNFGNTQSFLQIDTNANEVEIQERKAGYKTVDVDASGNTCVFNVKLPSGANVGGLNQKAVDVVDKALFRYIIADNFIVINYDVDIKFTMNGTWVGGSTGYCSLFLDIEPIDGVFSGSNIVERSQISQHLAFYDLAKAPDHVDVDTYVTRYDQRKWIEAKFTTDTAQVGLDYGWPQVNVGDTLSWQTFEVFEVDNAVQHRFVSRGTLFFNFYTGSGLVNPNILDKYDDLSNIEINY